MNKTAYDLWEDYFEYLIEICNLKDYCETYGKLFDTLHCTNFHFLLDRDDNRQWDGMKYRDDYLEDCCFIKNNKDIYEFKNFRCSVLEMLVGLAIRVEGEYIGDPADEHPEFFFMEMIENLGLDRFDNDNCIVKDIDKILLRWLDRKFTKTGKGSPFPVKRDKRDQRDLEIWDQMMSYINENHNE